MTYARAGHTPLIYVPGAGAPARGTCAILAPDGMVLGLKLDNGEMFERLLRRGDDRAAAPATSTCSSPTASARR